MKNFFGLKKIFALNFLAWKKLLPQISRHEKKILSRKNFSTQVARQFNPRNWVKVWGNELGSTLCLSIILSASNSLSASLQPQWVTFLTWVNFSTWKKFLGLKKIFASNFFGLKKFFASNFSAWKKIFASSCETVLQPNLGKCKMRKWVWFNL